MHDMATLVDQYYLIHKSILLLADLAYHLALQPVVTPHIDHFVERAPGKQLLLRKDPTDRFVSLVQIDLFFLVRSVFLPFRLYML